MEVVPSKKRRYPRIGLQRGMQVAWQGGGQRYVSQIVTAGLGGLFIKAKNPPQVGEILRLYFEVPGGEIRARAVVKNVVPGKGMGIQFTAMGSEARGRLALLLRHLMRDSPEDSTKSAHTLQA